MRLGKIVVGELETNCYLVWDEKGKLPHEAIVIDPGAEGERILEAIKQYSLKIIYIVNTHCHPDHIGANDFIKQKTGAELLIHSADLFLLEDSLVNLSPKRLLKEGDKIELGSFALEVLHTPGHTPGSISLYLKEENLLFSGDTLFAGGIGRTDLPGGNFKHLENSIRQKLLKFPDETVVYPGHGPETSIGKEIENWGR